MVRRLVAGAGSRVRGEVFRSEGGGEEEGGEIKERTLVAAARLIVGMDALNLGYR